jgi:CRISPR-associated endonuclease/helicase Cas3
VATAAYALQSAINLGLRRIFVVAPYTNIIAQTVEVLRRALVLPGELPEQVVAEIHHQVEFSKDEYRAFSVLWEALVIVTTAVQFFETLAAASTRALCKLHQLPGSVVVVDEAHAATPAHLFDLNLKWMEELREHWGCRFVLGSGSLVRFWDAAPEVKVHALASPELQQKLIESEAHRVKLVRVEELVDLERLLGRIDRLRGPRLVILNTLQNAAVVASKLETKQPGKVVHLSTALTPSDRKEIVDEVKQRLNQPDQDWTLVATSCVEAGVDFSFRLNQRGPMSPASTALAGAGGVGGCVV